MFVNSKEIQYGHDLPTKVADYYMSLILSYASFLLLPGLLQRLVDLVDCRNAGGVLAGFDAAEMLDADAGQLCQRPLRQSDGDAVADDLAGETGAGVLDGWVISVGIRFG